MAGIEFQSRQSCPGDCSACFQKDSGTEGSEVQGARRPLQGWPVAFLSVAIFIWPVVLAIVGAILLPRFWANEAAELVGGLGGLLIGVADSALSAFLLRKYRTGGSENG